MKGSRILIGMLSRNRPIMLRESVAALYRNPGMKFDLTVWSNGSIGEALETERNLAQEYGFTLVESKKNIGFRAWRKIFYPSRATHYVWMEDDMIWFEPQWLKKLYQAFICPVPAPKGWHGQWGIVSMVSLIDVVNNGAMWKSHFEHAETTMVNRREYILSLTACGAPMMFDAAVAKKIDAFGPWRGKIPIFGTYDAAINVKYRRHNYQVAHVKIFCYHANSPFWVSLYRDAFNEKQGSKTAFVESIAKYAKDSAAEGRPFIIEGKQWLHEMLREGTFQQYAEDLYASSAKQHIFIPEQ